VRAGQWLHVGPNKSRPFVEYFRGNASPEVVDGLSRSIKTLRHEIAHVLVSRTKAERPLRWLSEGMAETYARWPGSVDATARRMGIPVIDDFHKVLDLENEKYPDQVRALRALMQLAGIDTNDAKALSQLEHLWKDGVGAVPGKLAERISSRHPQVSRSEVERLIHGLSPNETDANPKAVLDLARRLGQRLELPG
jgi:hypothetical protein